jgi:hypothetical protein
MSVRILKSEVGDFRVDTTEKPPGSVAWLVPWAYPGYTRIFHPVPRRERSGAVSWHHVAKQTGRVSHAGMQFDRVVEGASQEYVSPMLADMGSKSLGTLIGHLSGLGPNECVVALWEGDEWTSVNWPDRDPQDSRLVDATSWAGAGLFQRPLGRRYRLFRAEVSAIPRFGRWVDESFFVPKQPSLFWAADKSWCVATDVDYDSTVVAAAESVQSALIGDPELEALVVSGEQSLVSTGDSINR